MNEKNIFTPYSSETQLGGCSCGAHASEAEHLRDQERVSRDFIEAAAVKALFPHEPTRRKFLKAVGASAAMAAIASVLPIPALQALADERGPLEKKNLKVGFIPINCATPLIMADPMGFYKEQGLSVSLQKTAGWALVRDNMLNRELDASHFLAPMPLAISMGLGSSTQPMRVATIQNINGQAITLALKHKNNRDPRNWKGFKFAIPFEFSMHNYLLRYYLAEHGLDPDQDVQLRVTPPAEMIANLRAGNIDGFLGPDPFNQRAVYDEIGFIHILSKDIWDGHPCCSFGTSEAFIKENPNTFAALYRAVLKSASAASDPANLKTIAQVISTPNYLNQPEIVIRQALTGRYADGLGVVQDDPGRAGFDPMPWYSMATWMLVQMKRWGYIKGEMNFNDLAEQVFLLTDARAQMAKLSLSEAEAAPRDGYKKFSVMGKEFDPAMANDYLNSFAIKRS
ncbi:ABC transporter substrate-binding protein [Pseudomonas fluorescens]|uniref:CmpA/NrtA family ABC transporter substrate-binding protein n=1 Tax=Pseudomonas paracarnis TaxID=2750625 RepID=UPI001780D263|nr:CmpA/NrtA family ABC transporter substrate-binding protein [Pseudomonas paracarnis]MBD8254085.1 ABC transporter substrate-binding protein [Pseudomonas fluorescens]MBH3398114.1 ABC transporter substrate-binding protein [Pseudomonas fluorescens]MDV3056584.1 CmpA/NrtA family ABC transporter substrate-binding protein [Pseudomonas paracarnis]